MKLLQQPVAALRNGKRGIFTSLITLTLVSSLTLSGCSSYDSFSRTTTGFSLGAMFGSAIGGILGGQRGYDIGTVVGGATGAVIGAASAESARKEREEYRREREAREYPYPAGRPSVDEAAESGISYGRFEPTRPTSVAPGNLEVSNIVFADATADRVLQPGEQAEITFDIYNRGNSPVRNVAPIVTADYDRVYVSQPAIISEILPGQGFRYRAAVAARNNAKRKPVVFTIAFPDGQGRTVEVRRFTVNVVKD
jgi:hypothetical protein